jgi:hypothetical protein
LDPVGQHRIAGDGEGFGRAVRVVDRDPIALMHATIIT